MRVKKKKGVTMHSLRALFYCLVAISCLTATASAAETYPELLNGVNVGDNVTQAEPKIYILNLVGHSNKSVTLELTAISGNPDLILKACVANEPCTISAAEINEANHASLSEVLPTYPTSPFIFSSRQESEIDRITFRSDPEKCALDSGAYIPHCQFAVAVINNGPSQQAEYSLSTIVHKNLTALYPSTPVTAKSNEWDRRFYNVQFPEGFTAGSISVSVTQLVGGVTWLLSLDDQFPENEEAEGYIKVKGESNYTMTWEESATSHMLFIGVKGEGQATFTILVTFSGQNQIINLPIGLPLKFEEKTCQPRLFNLSLDLSSREDNSLAKIKFLRVDVFNTKNTVQLFMNKAPQFPSEEESTWKSAENVLVVDNTDKQFVSVGNYLVLVNPIASSSKEGCGYTIGFSSSSESHVLEYNRPYSFVLAADEVRFFKLRLEKQVEVVSLIKTLENIFARVEIFVSYTEYIRFPSRKQHNESLPTGKSAIELNIIAHYAKALRECSDRMNTRTDSCFIHVGVYNLEPTEQKLDLMFYSQNSKIALPKDQPLRLPIPRHEREALNTYIVIDDAAAINQPITFEAFSREETEILIVGFVSSVNSKPFLRDWAWPTYITFNYTSGDRDSQPSYQGTSQLKIENLNSCPVENDVFRCAILLTIYVKPKRIDLSSASSGTHYPEILTLSRSGLSAKIVLGSTQADEVAQGQYLYYRLAVPKKKEKITIAVNSIGFGDPDVVVSRKSDVLPTIEANEGILHGVAGKILEISNDKQNASREWIIGVYGHSPCKFLVTATGEDNPIIETEPAIPIEIRSSETNIPRYYKYFHPREAGEFKVSLNVEFGAASLEVAPVGKKKKLSAVLASMSDSIGVSTIIPGPLDLIVKKDHKFYCEECYYLIKVLPVSSNLKAALLVHQPDQFIQLQNGRSLQFQLKPNEPYKFMFAPELRGLIEAKVAFGIFSGEPELYIHQNPAVSPEHHLRNYSFSTKGGTAFPLINFKINNTHSRKDRYFEEFVYDADGEVHYTTPDTFYFYAISKVASNCSILVSIPEKPILLIDGHAESGLLESNEKELFLFEVPQNAKEGQDLELLLTIHNAQWYDKTLGAQIMKADSFSPIGELPLLLAKHTSTNKAGKVSTKQIELDQSTFYHSTESFDPVLAYLRYTIPYYAGSYSFEVQNVHELPLNYSIVVKQQGPYQIQYGLEKLGRVETGKSEVYSASADVSGFVVIELQACYGSLEVGVAFNEKDYKNDEFTIGDWSKQSGFMRATYQVTPGPFFIRIRAIDGHSDGSGKLAALFKLNVRFYTDSQATVFEKLGITPGKVPEISAVKSQAAEIKWEEVTFEEATFRDVVKAWTLHLQYRVVSFEDPVKAASMAMCGILPGGNLQDYQDGNQTGLFVLDNLYPTNVTRRPRQPTSYLRDIPINPKANKTYISIVAEVVAAPKTLEVSAFTRRVKYDLVEIHEGDRQGFRTKDLLMYGAVVVAVALALAVYCGRGSNASAEKKEKPVKSIKMTKRHDKKEEESSRIKI